MKWTDEFRDEMRQRQLARLRYALIAFLVGGCLTVLMLGYIWLKWGIFQYEFLFMLWLSILAISLGLLFKYLLRYDVMVRSVALTALFLDMVGLPFLVYPFGMLHHVSILSFFPP